MFRTIAENPGKGTTSWHSSCPPHTPMRILCTRLVRLFAQARVLGSIQWSTLLALAVAPGLAMGAQLTLTWTDNANNESGYRIERKIGGGTYSEIAVLPSNSTSYTDLNLAGSTTHCYRVRAFNAVGTSGYSNEACKTTSLSTLALTVNKSGTGSGTVSSAPVGISCGSDCTEAFPGGTVATLTATPGSGSRFDGWSGGGCAGTGPCILTGNSSLTITATFTTIAAGPTCTTGQYLAEYYNNSGLTGSPASSRCETSIAYDWGAAGPGNGLGNDNFSVRWTGRFDFAAGSHLFTARADDGIRVWVDGASLINAWRDQSPTTYQATVSLTAGTHEVKVEYYERGGGAVAQVSWAAASGGGGSGGSIASIGSPIAKVTTPLGSGAGLSVIRDGDKPPVGNGSPARQYDSWDGNNSATEDWVGYTFPSSHTFSRVVFQEGIHFGDGGWFTSLTVQVRQNGQWVGVSNLAITPAYAGNNGVSYETYTLTFNPIQGDAIRLYGTPGGSAAFISVGELEVFEASGGGGAPVESRVSPRSVIARVPAPFGSGAGLTVVNDGDKPPVGSGNSARQYDSWDGNNPATEDWVGCEFTGQQTFTKLVFQEGIHFFDGGWFTTLTAQVRQNGQWVGVSNLAIAPAYAGNNGVSYETYTLTFNPIQGDAIRLYGTPGGSAAFISVGELEVFALVASGG